MGGEVSMATELPRLPLFQRPSQPDMLQAGDASIEAHEWVVLHVLNLLEQVAEQQLPPDHWFSRWRQSFLAFYGPLFADCPRDAAASRQALLDCEPSAIHLLSLFERVAQALPELVAGKQSVEDLLLCPGNLMLWERYFHDENRLYQINNVWLVRSLLPLLGKGGSMLELGGGFGSAAVTLCAAMSEEQRHNSELIFSEIVPFFLNRARRRLAAWQMPISYRQLDINQLSAAERPAPLDLIYAVNVLHVARDLQETLVLLRQWLKPGGHLVFAEAVRPALDIPIYPELVFGFFKDFHTAQTSALRPKAGFLCDETWQRLLEDAGFETRLWPCANPGPSYPFVSGSCLIARNP
jgi:SAM-dependent methyltransferase